MLIYFYLFILQIYYKLKIKRIFNFQYFYLIFYKNVIKNVIPAGIKLHEWDKMNTIPFMYKYILYK